MRLPRRIAAGVAGAWLSALSAYAAGTPDATITLKTRIALMTTDGVSVSDLSVETMNSVVTLYGKVPTEKEKNKAERVASEIDGVTSVKNLLQLVPNVRREVAPRSDEEVKSGVEAAFKANARIAGSGITVASVNKGVVSLAGTTSSLESHLESVQVAYAVKGVRRISSDVVVTPGT